MSTPDTAVIADLKQRISSKQATIICGTGLSILATEDTSLLWQEVVLNARDYAVDHRLAPFADWSNLVEQAVKNGVLSGDMQTLLSAAGMVAKALRDAQAWAPWASRRFANLTPTSDRVYKAIAGLSLPILTTNYDTLIEEALKYERVDRSQVTLFQSIFSPNNKGLVGHLHGVWSTPESMVFTESDYARVSENSGSGALHRASVTIRSAIYIGFGSGIGDPNFTAVKEYVGQKIEHSQLTHFRLCRQSELAELEGIHSDGSIVPVVYGDDYADLPGFIESLAYDKIKRGAIVLSAGSSREMARNNLLERTQDESLVSTISEHGCTTILSEPVILPVPQEVFDSKEQDDELQRVDPNVLAKSPKAVLLIGAERRGLTSAIRWLLLNRKGDDIESPVLINFKNVTVTKKAPISHALGREALSIGFISSPAHKLPPMAIGIDDFFVAANAADRLENDLISLKDNWLVIGCKPGDEPTVSSLLTDAEIEFETVYMGRMNSEDIGLYAKIVCPSRAKQLARRVITTLREERLSADPQTVLMLLGILITDQSASYAPTPSLVDLFVARLMTEIGSAPTRMDLEPQDLLDILEYFANHLAVNRVGELPLGQFLELLERYQGEVGWPLDPRDVLDRLVALRILSLRDLQVRFTLTSYLHLFVARHARNDEACRSLLLSEPFFFSDVLVHYSALARTDEDVLKAGMGLMECVAPVVPLGRTFSPLTDIDEVDVPEDAVLEFLDEEEHVPDEEIQDLKDNHVSSRDALSHVDRQIVPFAPDRELRADDFFSNLFACEFMTAILRNSDQIKNPALKKSAMFSMLSAVGRTVSFAEIDTEFLKLCDDVMRSIREYPDLSEELTEDIDSFLRYKFASFIAVTMVGSRLHGAKVSQTLDLIVAKALDEDDVRVATIGVVSSMLLRTPALRENLKIMAAKFPRVAYVREIVLPFAHWEYTSTRDKDLKATLEDFIVEVQMAFLKFKSINHRQAFKNAVLNEIRDRANKAIKEDQELAAEVTKAEKAIRALEDGA